jgi:hypothetical protein
MKRWIAELESYGCVRRNVIGIDARDPDNVVGIPIPWRVSMYRGTAPRGVGESYPFKWRVLQFFGIYLYLRRVRKAVREQNEA